MRALMLAFLFASTVSCNAEEKQIETSQSLAYTAAYLSVIERVCSIYFDVDKEITKKAVLNTFAKAVPLYGSEYFQKKALEEFVKISRGYDKSGPKDWCSEERGLTIQMGFKFFR